MRTVQHCFGFGSSVQCTVVDVEKLVNDISIYLGLCLKTELSVLYQMSIPLSEPLNVFYLAYGGKEKTNTG